MPDREKRPRSPVRSLHARSHVPSRPQNAAKVRGFSLTASGFTAETDWLLEEARFEPSVPLWLGAFTRSKTSMSGPVGVGGFEVGEFEGDGPLEKVAAQILLRGADAVQLRAQETTKPRNPGLSCSVIHSACTKLTGSGCGAREAQSR